MFKRWLHREGKEWVREGIITKEQLTRILARNPGPDRRMSWLPILAGILIGLGILSFIASNWEGIPPFLRLLILIGGMTGFYAAGEQCTRQGFPHTGAVLTGLGVVTFGGGMVLVGQMYHLVAFDVRLFILWGTAALISTFLYRHPVLFYLTFVILSAAQWYSTEEFRTFSYGTAMLFFAGLGWEAHRSEHRLHRWFVAAGVVHQSLLWVIGSEEEALWLFPFLMVLYTAGDWWHSRGWRRPLQTVSISAAFLMTLVVYYNPPGESGTFPSLPASLPYLTLTAGFLALSLRAKHRWGRLRESDSWLLFLPFFYLTADGPQWLHQAVYLVVLYAASVGVLLRGSRRGSRFEANWGILLFLVTTVNAYFNLAWDFMPKSLFFLLGGLLLFALNRFLQHRKNTRFSKGGDGR